MTIQEVKKLLNEKSIITKEEYIECFKALSDEINNHKVEGIINSLIMLKDLVITNELYSSRIDIIFINILFIRTYLYQNRAWKSRMFVNECIELLDDILFDSDKMMGAEVYKILGDASSCYLDCRTAYMCYAHSVSLYLETSYPLEYIAYIAKLMIVSLNMLHDKPHELPTEDEIKEMFKEYSDDLIDALNGKGYILHDEIEQSEAFQEMYDEVMEVVDARLLEDNNTSVLYRWSIMEEEFKKRGIKWKSPKRMNPSVKFE